MSRTFTHSASGPVSPFRGRKSHVRRKLTRNERWQLVKLIVWGIVVLAITAYLVWPSSRDEDKEEGNYPHASLRR